MEKIRYYILNLFYKCQFKLGVLLGYIYEDGAPKKCHKCGCKDFYDIDIYHEDWYECEFTRVCIKCGNKVGHWAYGYWER